MIFLQLAADASEVFKVVQQVRPNQERGVVIYSILYIYHKFSWHFNFCNFMQWRLITVGKPALPWARDGFAMYFSRLSKVTRIEHVIIKEGALEQVTTQTLEASADSLRILFDERGKQRRSVELARWVEQQEISGRKRISLIIGGANGHGDKLRAAADECWSLSAMTFQHEMALVVVAEQLYRAYSILRKEPYHRE